METEGEVRKCLTPNCYRTPLPQRRRCQTCRYRSWSKNNPLRATYIKLKSNAKKRNKPFNLTFEYWKKFCEETNYLELRGQGKYDMTVDCEDDYVGYVDGGITMRTKYENSKIGKKKRKAGGLFAGLPPVKDAPF